VTCMSPELQIKHIFLFFRHICMTYKGRAGVYREQRCFHRVHGTEAYIGYPYMTHIWPHHLSHICFKFHVDCTVRSIQSKRRTVLNKTIVSKIMNDRYALTVKIVPSSVISCMAGNELRPTFR